MSPVTVLIGDAGTGKTARLRDIVAAEHNSPDTVIVSSLPDSTGDEYPLGLQVRRIPDVDTPWDQAVDDWNTLGPTMEYMLQMADAETLVVDVQLDDDSETRLREAVPVIVEKAAGNSQRLYLAVRPHVVPFLLDKGVAAHVDSVEVTAPPKMRDLWQPVETFVKAVGATG